MMPFSLYHIILQQCVQSKPGSTNMSCTHTKAYLAAQCTRISTYFSGTAQHSKAQH